MMSDSVTQVVARHYATQRAVRLEIARGRIEALVELGSKADARNDLPWVAPGFVDIQTNGYGGQEFSSPELTVEGVARIAAKQGAFGVARFCPTVTTAGRETILHSVRTIAEARRQSPELAYQVAGIHVEGPYISRDEGPRGAHPLEHCRPPDWDEFAQFQDAADGQIRLLTLSPEYPQAPAFIERAVHSGVVVAIGHTSASAEQIHAAVDAGASLSTHLGNGAHRMLPRHPNYIWDQLAIDQLAASMIVDGHHLPREVVQTFVRAKTPERCLLISDLSGMAGLPAGRYQTGLCELEILDDGRLVIAGQNQLLAGAARGIEVGVANVMAFAGVDLATAVAMASHHPARLLRLPICTLKQGDVADVVVFDLQGPVDAPRLRVLDTYACGRRVFPAP